MNPRFDFEVGQIIGFAENISSPARTLQCFLVSSAFGSFKELVSLHPLKNADGSDLHALTLQIINFIHSCDLKIVVIVSDNRGGLYTPSNLCIQIGKHAFCIINVLISVQYEDQILQNGKQKQLLQSLTKTSIMTENLDVRFFV